MDRMKQSYTMELIYRMNRPHFVAEKTVKVRHVACTRLSATVHIFFFFLQRESRLPRVQFIRMNVSLGMTKLKKHACKDTANWQRKANDTNVMVLVIVY